MRGFIARVFITAFGLWMADTILGGIRFDGLAALWLAALLLGLINAFIRPIVIFLTFPITLVTLGLFLFVINGAMLMLVASMMRSFHIDGLGSAILASIIVGLTGWMANAFVGNKGKVEVWNVKPRRGR
ncbi:MAG: phage holin family protein [Gemmatimonadales bacterium]|nr:phage holin family protein [Gemmatimonadales bacterium]NIN11283.1 phage holin family protein [Gemmatimonadales bacterium]NIN49882.1 phage holin family protein [Gemmatimonadales bacterium]NIP07346.1 phage holin family protein [Gemmatimonadales bacterium]NIR03041.1 phage holin family protein [Gemmatimonadales bacterium]